MNVSGIAMFQALWLHTHCLAWKRIPNNCFHNRLQTVSECPELQPFESCSLVRRRAEVGADRVKAPACSQSPFWPGESLLKLQKQWRRKAASEYWKASRSLLGEKKSKDMECCKTSLRWSKGWLVVMPFQNTQCLDTNCEKQELHFWAPAQ